MDDCREMMYEAGFTVLEGAVTTRPSRSISVTLTWPRGVREAIDKCRPQVLRRIPRTVRCHLRAGY